MSLASSNFIKHGHTSFDVWLANGQTTCVVFKEYDAITVALLQRQIWQSMEWAPEKGSALFANYHIRVHDVRIVKSGWFASATVDFITWNGHTHVTLQGKTDKGFAEFLASIAGQISRE